MGHEKPTIIITVDSVAVTSLHASMKHDSINLVEEVLLYVYY